MVGWLVVCANLGIVLGRGLVGGLIVGANWGVVLGRGVVRGLVVGVTVDGSEVLAGGLVGRRVLAR